MDDVYHSVAFQALMHFRLPSDFGKLLKEGFVIEIGGFSCAILLSLFNTFFCNIDSKVFSLVERH